MAQIRAGELTKVVHKVEVVYHSGPLTLPEGMTLEDADQALHELIDYEKQEVNISETFPVFVWDGARALNKAMHDLFGWAQGAPIRTMFGDKPPQIISVEVGPGITEGVPFGKFHVPGIGKADGYIMAASGMVDGRVCFKMDATVRRRHETTIRKLIARTKEILKTDSIYRGKAFRVRFSDPDTGEKLPMPEPRFLDLQRVNEAELVFSEEVGDAIADNLFTPIDRFDETVSECGSWKRGVLLCGVFGTGKTLAAMVAAKKAIENDITFVYLDNPHDFQEGVRFALQYANPGAIVFQEDVDRTVRGERSIEVDKLLNIADGIETKNHPIMFVFTTNHVENIQQAAIRPGRLDAVIEVKPPDPVAVTKLVQLAAGDRLHKDEDLMEVGQVLDGAIPAVIREVVKRAKLSAIRRTPRGKPISLLTSVDLVRAAKTMAMQRELLGRKVETPRDPLAEQHQQFLKALFESPEWKQVQRTMVETGVATGATESKNLASAKR